MGSMFPALDIRPPANPIEQFGQAQAIVGQQQQIEAQRLQNQITQRTLQDQDAMTRAMSQWDGKDYGALPTLVKNAGGSANAVMGLTKNIFGIKQQASEIAKNDAATNLSNADTIAKQNDAYRGRILNITDGITDPAQKQTAWAAEIAKEQAAGTPLPPGITAQYPGDDKARAIANSFALGSQLVKEADDKQRLAIDAWKPVGGQLVNAISGEKIGGIPNPDSLNNALQTRYQVLNPGKPLPDFFKMSATSTPADFDRIDKIMQQTEQAQGTVAQREQTQAMRSQTFELMRDKQDLNPVTGIDPKSGNQVLVPYSQAQQMGLQNPLKADDDMVNKAYAARHWLTLATKPAPAGADPQDMSIQQLVDKLDKDGKLGAVASRWNEFMTGKVGEGDPDVAALRAKMGLSTTLLMQAHVGSRGSSEMLEHFEDLANQKKLDGPTLKAAIGSEISYVRDRSMDPNPPNYSATVPTGGAANSGAPKLPQGAGKTIDKDTAMQFYQAAGNDPAKAKQLAIQNGWKVPQAR